MVRTADLLPLAVAVPLLGAVVLVIVGRRLPRLANDVLVTAGAGLEVAGLGGAAGRHDCGARAVTERTFSDRLPMGALRPPEPALE